MGDGQSLTWSESSHATARSDRYRRAWQYLLGILSVTGLLGLVTLGGPAHAGSPPKGYLLITIESDMPGTLPIKPSSFFGPPPFFLPLKSHKDYLYTVRPSSYTFGGLVVGMKIGWSLKDQAPFNVEAGKVVYLGLHRFKRTSDKAYRWEAVDDLEGSLADLSPEERKQIDGLPIVRSVPVPKEDPTKSTVP
jgi:hypothetical protein